MTMQGDFSLGFSYHRIIAPLARYHPSTPVICQEWLLEASPSDSRTSALTGALLGLGHPLVEWQALQAGAVVCV